MKRITQFFSLTLVTLLILASCAEQKKSTIYTTEFEDFETAMLSDVTNEGCRWFAADSTAQIAEPKESQSGKVLHILPGENKYLTIELPNSEEITSLKFKARAVKQANFKFNIEALVGNDWIEVYNGNEELIKRNRVIYVSTDINKVSSKLRFTATTKEMGVFLDDFTIYRAAKSTLEEITARQPLLPVFKLKEINKVVEINIKIDGNLEPLELTSLDFNLDGTTDLKDIQNIQVYYSEASKHIKKEGLFGELENISQAFSITGKQVLNTGDNYFWLSTTLNNASNLSNKIGASCLSVKLSNGETIIPTISETTRPQRIGVAVRQKNDNNVHTYRIPGLATTNKGTLIGVYDNRYSQGADLQGDIDVAMSRSTDGGTTWEPMKPIIDMGEYGGLPQDQNGIGDPAVLVDRSNNTIWVAGVWAHGHPGERNWWASKQGMKPAETSQFVIAKSEDDGLTWSDPINITKQIKDKKWFLLLQGPGKGITLKDGTLVFPAQFKDDKEMPHSTIIYSKDHGKTWKIGTGAKPNTTEAQVVELENGSLMLNMRDNRGGSRSVYTTKDFGKTWEAHETSRKTLIEPVCMASLISFDHPEKGQILFFSNPNSIKGRTHMTIKISFDQGKTWPVENQLELYEDGSYGYSCMTVVDENHIGILYEGSAELYYEKININELF